MDQLLAALYGGANVLLVSLIFGVGSPVLFTLGIKALAWSDGKSLKGGLAMPHPIGKLYAAILFGIIGLAIAFGISYLVVHGLGYKVVFNGIVPAIKK
ncbi:MAG: hypothetical protein WAV45_10150 [Propionibacteriaceae bacterium]|nr:hypothetical protein [Micropruina sp.]HBX80085.1 hypothetical protein [Propionibacteriaceae bacterium]HBY23978.1 hypothetical protein [Propionibacteriaceae bacterium]